MYEKMKKVFCYGMMLLALSLVGSVIPKDVVDAALLNLQNTEVKSYGAADLTISNAREFSEFANNVSNGNTYEGKLVVLSEDIKFDGVTTNNYSPATKEFNGIFDGMGHTVSGIDVTNNKYPALFALIGSSGVVKNVTVKNSSFQGSGDAGGIASENYGSIYNCAVVDCSIKSSGDNTGGIVGIHTCGAIVNCYTMNSVIVGQYWNTGGIAGRVGCAWTLDNGSIFRSATSVYRSGTISNCANLSSVTTQCTRDGKAIGGIAGRVVASSTLENNYNIGKVNATTSDGHIGAIAGTVEKSGIVAHSYTSTSANSRNFGAMNGTEKDNKAYSDADMKTAAFLNLLNTNRGSRTDWAKWEKRAESAYPLPAKATDITKCIATLSTASVTYNFKEQKPTVIVTNNGTVLVEGVDYTVIYPENMTNPGEKIITVDSVGTYYGRIELVYTIEKADQILTGTTSYSKVYSSKSFYLDIKRTEGDGKITYASSDKKVVKLGAGGSVNSVGIGKAVITVNAAETDYFKPASIQITVTIKPFKVNLFSAYRSNGKILMSWSRDNKAKGYQLQYSTSKKFKKNVKNVTIKKNKKTSYKSKRVKSGKKYYVRVRAYKNGVYGSWSRIAKVK